MLKVASNETTLKSGNKLRQEIIVGPGKFVKKNKRM
jgi:hypothetical protein